MSLFKAASNSGTTVEVTTEERDGALYISLIENYGKGATVYHRIERNLYRQHDQRFIDDAIRQAKERIVIWNDVDREFREQQSKRST